MKRIRVRLEFVLVFADDHPTGGGITQELEDVSWFGPIGQTICKRLGVASVEKVRRELRVVEPRKRATHTKGSAHGR